MKLTVWSKQTYIAIASVRITAHHFLAYSTHAHWVHLTEWQSKVKWMNSLIPLYGPNFLQIINLLFVSVSVLISSFICIVFFIFRSKLKSGLRKLIIERHKLNEMKRTYVDLCELNKQINNQINRSIDWLTPRSVIKLMLYSSVNQRPQNRLRNGNNDNHNEVRKKNEIQNSKRQSKKVSGMRKRCN